MVRYIDIKKVVNKIIDNVLLFYCNENRECVTLYMDDLCDWTHIIQAIITGQRNASTLTMTIEIKETKRLTYKECREKKISIKESTKREIIGKYAKDYDITERGIWYKLIHEIKVGKELADGINSVLDNKDVTRINEVQGQMMDLTHLTKEEVNACQTSDNNK